jgi:chromosome segregation protein
MEGYPESIKFLHKNQGWNHTAPILSDIIYVKEDFRAAVENVLEPYLNYYVVNDLQEGLQAVHLLDAHKKGKANFFLLDKLNAMPLNTVAASGIQGTFAALDVVEFDPTYENLVRYLLGNVLIAESEEALAESNGHVILEKHGKYVKGKYSLTGGSVGLFEGKKIGRAKNLEKLVEEIAAQEIIVNDLKASIQERHDEVITYNRQLNEQAIRQTQEQINESVNRVYALQNKLESLHQTASNAAQRKSDLEVQMQDSQDQISGAREALDTLNAKLELLQDRIQVIEADYSLAEQEYAFANASFNEVNLQYTRQQARLTALKQELQFKTNQVNDLQSQMTVSKTQLEDASIQIATTRSTLQTLEDGLLEMFQQKEVEERKLNEADQTFHNLRNVLSAKETELRQKSRQKESLDEILNKIKDNVNELRLQLAGIKERLRVEFKVDIEQIMDEPRKSNDTLEELQASCDRMKKRLENMGEVNPTAIEAFTEMKKRFDFIVEQKNDLTSAKDTLMQTIQEVEATANQKFLETFNKVRENFQKVFKALFTEEDTADMIMENPENLADTGIDIIAKPKGKRPTSITQLSGGEKTLTATALLFAIYLIKPAPFCILDEVDAPLDDANVGKFTKMIRQFSKESQFIIVTHNKTTMSTVDIIYGVTMQEAGVSKLVAVDFRNLEEQAIAS